MSKKILPKTFFFKSQPKKFKKLLEKNFSKNFSNYFDFTRIIIYFEIHYLHVKSTNF